MRARRAVHSRRRAGVLLSTPYFRRAKGGVEVHGAVVKMFGVAFAPGMLDERWTVAEHGAEPRGELRTPPVLIEGELVPMGEEVPGAGARMHQGLRAEDPLGMCGIVAHAARRQPAIGGADAGIVEGAEVQAPFAQGRPVLEIVPE